jgi:hypothetical protein
MRGTDINTTDSERDTMITLPLLGALTYREWHAVIDGLYCGYVDVHAHEYTTEKHYWRVGWLLGHHWHRADADE